MSSTNKTTHYELSQYIGTDKPTYLGDYNSDMLAIDTAIHNAADNASTAVSTANSAASTASDAATAASAATTTANNAANTANLAKTTAETASTNANAALTAAQGAQTAAAANTINNLAPAYDPTLTYAVGDLVTYVDDQGSGKLYKNIVPIDVPEAFNINKWDDVTTSEVYSKKSTLIASYDTDGTETYLNAYTALYQASGGSFNITSEYLLIDSFQNSISIKHSLRVTNNSLVFTSVSVDTSTTEIDSFTLGDTISLLRNINGTTESFANSTISARTLKLYKLETI